MSEKIGMYTKEEILKYMTDCDGPFLGRSMFDAIFEKIDKLKKENENLKQQLKDKDEKISKVKELLKNTSEIESEYKVDIDNIKLILEILESNKED